MIVVGGVPRVESATSVDAAVKRLAELGQDAAALAGATWLMRSPTPPPPVLVALHRVPEMRGAGGDDWGALSTHAELAAAPLPPALRALRTAAHRSAFPQVRNVATLGGNLSTRGFAEADLVPALLALDATVEAATSRGRHRLGLDSYLDGGFDDGPAVLVRVRADAAPGQRSGYARLTVRGGGEYALASVAISTVLDPTGLASAVRVAVGSVERRARRCPEAEEALAGTPLDERSARAAGHAAARVLSPRDDPLAPGWYRLAVLPALFTRAIADLLADPTLEVKTG